jgi:hypothetical protein
MPTAFDGGQAAACLELPCRGRKAVTAISTRSSSTPSSVLRSGKRHVGPDRPGLREDRPWVAPVSKGYFHFHLRRHGVDLDRIRKDRILHEALTAGPDPLHLALVFNLSHTTASRYATIA